MRGVHSPGDVLTLTAPVGGVTSGRAYKIGQVITIAMIDAVEAASFSGLVSGAVFVDKVSAQAWTEGAFIYWDDSARLFTTVSGGNTPAGIAATVAANPSAIGVVRLGLALASGGGGGGTPAGDEGAVQFNDGGAFGGYDPAAYTLIRKAVLPLTDAQIKGGPTQAEAYTGPEIVAAPGAGKVLLPVAAIAVARKVDAYTNVNAAADMLVYWDGISTTDPTPKVLLSQLLAFPGDSFALLPLTGWNIDVGYAPYPSGFSSALADAEDKPLVLFLDNIGSGDFEDGHADNTLTVTVYYLVVDVGVPA